MAKSTGLGDRLIVGGVDISGDAQSVKTSTGGLKTLDMTDITESAFERQLGEFDGAMSGVVYYDKTTAHPVLSALPRGDQHVMYCRGATVGSPAACMVGKETDYSGNRANDGSLLFSYSSVANGFGYEWGVLLTPGVRTDTTATNGASYDSGQGVAAPAVPASGTPVTNSSPIAVSVVITGGTMTNVVINGVSVGAGAGTYNLPAGASITLTYTVAPTWTWTVSTAFGLQAYLQVTAFTGTSVTVTLQDSADNSSWANIASAAFTAVTAAPAMQRLAIANTATVRRYVRAITSGTFTSASFVCAFNRNTSAGVAF